MKKNIFIFLIACLAVSCNRDLEFDTISVTEPSLTVQVEGAAVNNTYPKMEGAVVKLYNSSNALLATKNTNSSGQAIFTKAELVSEGVFTAIATKGSLTGQKATPYMLLNDGATLLIITIQ